MPCTWLRKVADYTSGTYRAVYTAKLAKTMTEP